MLQELTQTLLCGLIPLALAAAALLGLQRRFPAVRALGLPALVAAFAAGIAAGNAAGIGDVAQGEMILRATLWFLALVLLLRLLAHYAFTLVLERQWRVRVPPLLPRVTRGLLYMAAALGVLSATFPAARVGPLLATSAVTSLVLGLALQPILTNFFAGVVIALERPFRINDWIRVGDHEGRVTAITWRTTSIRTRENDTVIFPNASVAQDTVINFLYPHPLHMSRIYVGVHYRTPPHEARAAMLDAASRVTGVLEQPSADVYVHSFSDSSITYELRAWVDDMASLHRIESDARREVWEEFRRRGIVIPFPIRTVEIAPRRRRTPPEGQRPAARLFVSAGGGRGTVTAIGEVGVVAGRDPDCDLVLHERTASKRHFRIAWDNGGYRFHDLGSTHGTLLNGRPAREAVLADLDKLQIGDSVIVFELHER